MNELWDSEQVPTLSLRPITVDDIPRTHEWTSDERACRYQTWGPNTLPETEAFVVAAVEAWTDEGAARRVWVAVDPGLGGVGIGELKRRTSSYLEIAYTVQVDLWLGALAPRSPCCFRTLRSQTPSPGGSKRRAIRGTSAPRRCWRASG